MQRIKAEKVPKRRLLLGEVQASVVYFTLFLGIVAVDDVRETKAFCISASFWCRLGTGRTKEQLTCQWWEGTRRPRCKGPASRKATLRITCLCVWSSRRISDGVSNVAGLQQSYAFVIRKA